MVELTNTRRSPKRTSGIGVKQPEKKKKTRRNIKLRDPPTCTYEACIPQKLAGFIFALGGVCRKVPDGKLWTPLFSLVAVSRARLFLPRKFSKNDVAQTKPFWKYPWTVPYKFIGSIQKDLENGFV